MRTSSSRPVQFIGQGSPLPELTARNSPSQTTSGYYSGCLRVHSGGIT